MSSMFYLLPRGIKNPWSFGGFTNFLKNGCLPSIGAANNEDSEAAILGTDICRHMTVKRQIFIGEGKGRSVFRWAR